ncbi:MAG: glycosyl transferase, family 39, partial [Anaerolineales bacterium]|nr:glycosyl transferase, family 39 [Anaerolineales bacterium]
MSLDSVYINWIILTGLAVVLDVWLIRWVRRNWQADESSPHVRVLGSYSPILTWLKYRRLLTWKRRRPSVAATSFAPSVSRIETPAASAFNPELSHRIALIVLLLSAVGLMALGQQIFIRAPETRVTGLPFIVGGVGLFVLGRHLYLTRALPNWLNALSARLRITPFQLILLLLAGMSAYAARFFAGNDAKMLNPLAAVASWLAALGLVMTGSYDFGAGRNSSAVSEVLGPSWSRREMFAMAALMIFAFLVRAVANGEIPHVLTGDEGSAGLAAVDILEGRFNNPFIVSWFSFPSLFFFAPAVSIGIWGQTYEALRLPSAFAGALTVGGLYWLARPMFGRGVAGVSAAMLATLNFHVHFSRIGLNNIWDGLFAVLALGMLWRGWLSGRRSYFVGAGFLVGLSHYFYTSATVVPLMMLAWLTLATAVN